MSKKVKVYEIYPQPSGGYDNRSIKYFGKVVAVAAVSLKQAYFLAYENMWANKDDDNPTGILWVYDKFRDPGVKDHEIMEGVWVLGSPAGLCMYPRHMEKVDRIRQYLESLSEMSPRSSEDRAVAS